MMRALIGVATLAGLLVVVVFQLTLPIITAKKAEALQNAIYDVVPNALKVVGFRLGNEGELVTISEGDKSQPFLYAAYSNSGDLAGVAVETSGQGYQETIRVIYGYNLETQKIVGLKVLESKETPGLGDKIEKDLNFVENFKALDVRLDDNGEKLENHIVTVKSGEKTNPWQIDGITGATISSKAIGRILNTSAGQRLPVIARNLANLKKGLNGSN